MLYQPPKNIEAYVLAKKGAEKSYPFGEDVAVYKVKNKMFVALMGSMGINLKCDPDEAVIYRQMFDGVTPAYHMNKEHWNSVALDSDVPEDVGPVNTNDDVVAAAPNEANQGARREVWWFQMNAKQRRVVSFGAQPAGIGHFSVLLRYRKLMCNKHTSLAKPCRNEKMAESTPAELVLTGPLIHNMIDDSYHLVVARLSKKDRERILGGFT